MRVLTVLLGIVLHVGCIGAIDIPAEHGRTALRVVEGEGYRGVIFPSFSGEGTVKNFGYEGSSYWTPTPAQVAQFEKGLPAALRSASGTAGFLSPPCSQSPDCREWMAGEAGEILKQLADYRRQYVGIRVESGARVLFVNVLAAPADGQRDLTDDWRWSFAVVDDGGSDYWRIQYEMSSERYFHFEVNGL